LERSSSVTSSTNSLLRRATNFSRLSSAPTPLSGSSPARIR
jgi:hypothetical protein